MERMTFRNSIGEKPSPFWESFVLPILKYKKLTYIVVSSSVGAALLFCAFARNKYTSTATILPSGSSEIATELKDIAAGSLGELGLGASVQAPENSSALFPSILTSRLLSERVLTRNYSFYFRSRPYSLTLQEYIDAPNIDRALKALRRLVRVEHDRRNGVITLSVTTRFPELSAAVVHAYLEELDDYNIHHRQSKAAENERFTAQRLQEIKLELAAAEDSLKSLQEANMNYMISADPELQLELARLQREVSLMSALYLAMAQQNETAKVEAAKDIPIVQVLDKGAIPRLKSGPRRSLYLLGALAGSLFASVLISLWLDLSVKRGLNKHLKQVVHSPVVRMGKIESRIANRITRIADSIEREPDNSVAERIQ